MLGEERRKKNQPPATEQVSSTPWLWGPRESTRADQGARLESRGPIFWQRKVDPKNSELPQLPRSLERVFHEHRDGHRSDSTGNRCDGGASWSDFVVSYISREAIAGFF